VEMDVEVAQEAQKADDEFATRNQPKKLKVSDDPAEMD